MLTNAKKVINAKKNAAERRVGSAQFEKVILSEEMKKVREHFRQREDKLQRPRSRRMRILGITGIGSPSI